MTPPATMVPPELLPALPAILGAVAHPATTRAKPRMAKFRIVRRIQQLTTSAAVEQIDSQVPQRRLRAGEMVLTGTGKPARLSAVWQWARDDGQVAIINLRAEADRLCLSYRYRFDGGEWEDVNETVPIVRVPCHLGGSRPFFVCPGVVNGRGCGRRVAKLHGPGRYFLCRHCYRLANASQSESAEDRARRRASKIRQRLGGSPGLSEPLPPKPKGMWQRTYERLREQAISADMVADEAFVLGAQRLLARIKHSNGKRSFRP